MANATETVEIITGGSRVSAANPIPIEQSGVTYKGEETIALAGASAACTIPADSTMALITAEGGPVYYTINGAAASANSGGYVPDGQSRYTMELASFTALHVFGANPAKAHVQYYAA